MTELKKTKRIKTSKQINLIKLLKKNVKLLESGQPIMDINEMLLKAGYSPNTVIAKKKEILGSEAIQAEIIEYETRCKSIAERLDERIAKDTMSDQNLIKAFEVFKKFSLLKQEKPTSIQRLDGLIEIRDLILNANIDLNQNEPTTERQNITAG